MYRVVMNSVKHECAAFHRKSECNRPLVSLIGLMQQSDFSITKNMLKYVTKISGGNSTSTNLSTGLST